MPKQEITITLPTELIESVKELAAASGITESEYTEHLLTVNLKKLHENKAFTWLLKLHTETQEKYMKEGKRNFISEHFLKDTYEKFRLKLVDLEKENDFNLIKLKNANKALKGFHELAKIHNNE
jgi:hypothetical protein